ncbi:MAG TPA: MtrB/PioB family decaheme-associated outer membrane protein [Burkholderiales bacterium]|nr:MtrB/PioB family decaheme-associated outer membrane protein [Burkholderiales bacterium]
MTTSTLRVLVAAALAAQTAAVSAQQAAAEAPLPPDTSKWECKSCPFPQGVSGDVGAGAVNVSEDSFQFGRYTGLKKGTYLGLDADARYAGSAGYADFIGTDLGLPYRSLEYQHWLNGFKWNVGYAELPFLISDSARTPFSGNGGSSLTLPPTWVRGGTTQTMPGLDAALQDVKIDSTRKRIGVGLAYVPASDWDVGLNVKHETRDGTKRTSASFFLNSTNLVAPVDYSTDDLEAYASYAVSKWQVRFAYQVSMFKDDNTALRWDNPFAEVLAGATVGQLGLPPSNQFHQVSATGAYQFTDDTRGTASVALGRMEQDEAFLPATINPTIPPVALPRSSLQGLVDTTKVDLKLVSALSEKWGLNAAYLYDDRNNKTPQSSFNWVTTDLQPAPAPRVNLPYGYTRNLFKLWADYRVTPRDKASVGVDRDGFARTFQEVSKTTEDTAWAKYALRRSQFDASVNIARGHRDGTAYTPVPQISPPENPLLRKYNMADRDRLLVGLRAAATVTETVTVGLDYSQAKDDYNNSPVGLTSSKENTAGINATAQFNQTTSLNVYYTWQRIRSSQAGAQSFSNPPDWSGDNTDTTQTAGIGLKHKLIEDKLDVGVDFTISRSVGDITVTTALNEPAFPSVKSDLNSLKIYANYKVTDALSVYAAVWHERYESQNWAVDGVGPSTIPNVLAFGETSPQYKVNVASLTARYRF